MNPHPSLAAQIARALTLRNRTKPDTGEVALHQEPDEIFRSILCSIIQQAITDWRWALRSNYVSEDDPWNLSPDGMRYRMRKLVGRNLEKREPFAGQTGDTPKSIAEIVSAFRYISGHGMDFDCDLLALDVEGIRKQLRKEHADYYEHR